MHKAPIKNILKYLSQGFNQSQIAKKFKVSRQLISLNLKNTNPKIIKNHFDKFPKKILPKKEIDLTIKLARQKARQKKYNKKRKLIKNALQSL
jgi:transposase